MGKPIPPSTGLKEMVLRWVMLPLRPPHSRKIDVTPPRRNDGGMRTTVDLPDELHRAVASIAAHGRKSMNRIVAESIRRGR